jgi:outer membrane receptor protein involved in Fe transport
MRARPRFTAGLLTVLVLASGAATAAAASNAAWAGRPLSQALDRLRDLGLRLVYGSNVVHPGMFVFAEPLEESPRRILDEILAPHGLLAEETTSGILRIVFAPEGRVEGRVTDADSGSPIAGAEIEVESLASAHTGRDGRFEIGRLPAGRHPIEARKAGFAIERREIEVEAGGRLSVDLLLQPVADTLDEIVVTPGRVTLFREDPTPEVHWTRAEISRLPHLSDDLFRAVSRLPGIAAGDFSADFHVRGGERSEVLVLIDGLRVFEPFHLKDFQNVFSIFDTRATGSVEVMSGGFTAEFGDRMSSVIEISSLIPTERRTMIGVSFEKVHFADQGLLKGSGGDWLVSARRGYLDVLVDFAQTGDDNFHLRPSYYDVFAKLRRSAGAGHLLAASLLAAADTMTFESDDDDDALESSYGNAYTWLRLDSVLGRTLSQATVLAVGRLDSERRGRSGSNLSDPFLVNRTDTDLTRVFDRRDTQLLQLRQNWRYDSSPRHHLRWGVEAQRLEADYDYDQDNRITDPVFTDDEIVVSRTLDLKPSGSSYAIYVAHRMLLSEDLTIEGGLRWDRQTYASDEQTSPRVNLVARLAPRTTLRASWGEYAQAQGIHELQVADGVDTFHPAQINRQTTLALDHQLSSTSRIAAQVYTKGITDPRPRFENLFEPIDIFPEGQSDRVRVAPERARSRGLELLVERRSSRFDTWIAYTLSEAEDEIQGRWVPRSWDQRHAVTYSVNRDFEGRWNLNLAGTHHTGWPVTDVELAVAPDGTLRLAPGERNRSRFPDYHRLDVRASRTLPLRKGALELFLEITNLLDRDNIRSISDFAIVPGATGAPVIQREFEKWFPRLPSFGLTWVF